MAEENLFEGLPSTAVSDGLQGYNHMKNGVYPLKEKWQLSGPAFTVDVSGGENLSLLKAIRSASEGDVLVIDGKGERSVAIAGDFIIGLAKTLGLKGIVVDGVIRDLEAIRDLDFPVFCIGTTPVASKKNEYGKLQVPITCGGVVVSPGDYIVADVDGVVVVPKEDAKDVYMKTLDKIAKDEKREKEIGNDPKKARKYLEQY
ncbi:RraA family protein [Geomicrobium sediminis]|uniref:Putative 4-hydroxy-4-methyl-2-oxoglutarate aldolase n=1 Tax=Geomicrobium sediminis TaxID=1347788 RepID=A0ABS2PHR7_9BACL|nr:RraA family protein [Geomicrobium sediminis]MBM7634980.1 RraA family protein [Geomicrobium sediminis]